MGSELSLASLWIRNDREPDWQAAHRAIRDLELATVWNTGDEFFPWEGWLEDAPNPPASAGVYRGLRAAQGHLVETLDEVRAAIERGTHDMLVVELPKHRVFVSGCVTSGDMPPGPFEAFGVFAEAGLARAAGFDGWTAYCPVALEARSVDFAENESRSVAATRALMFAEDLALEGPLADALFTAEPPERMAQLWLEPLSGVRRLRRREHVLRALMLFGAQTYALLNELWSQGGNDDGLSLPEVPPVIVETTDVLDHHEFTRERFTDLEATVADLVGEAEHWAGQLRLLAEEHAIEQTERAHGSQLPQALAVTIIAHFFSRLLVAFADLADDDLAAAAAPRQSPAAGAHWRRGRLVDPSYERYLGWCAAPALDLAAARSAVEGTENPALREHLRRDLEPFAVLASGEYSRLVASEQVGELTVWFTAETWRDGWTLNEPLRRLGEAGILRAAGAVAWSAG
jgi:hypothetical protein